MRTQETIQTFCCQQSSPRYNVPMSKLRGLLYLLLVYVLAFGIGLSVEVILLRAGWDVLLSLLLVDVIATVIVYLFGLASKSPSVYDPYWSVQTLFFYLFLLIYYGNWNLGTILVLVALTYYSVRLTANFIIGFDDIHYIDWRYKMLKAKSGKLFQIVNFFGINMMPTLLVYLASVPFFLYGLNRGFSLWDLVALITMVGAVTLELVADAQMKAWVKTRTDRGQIIDRGLWKYSRHPNYLGEILFWVGGAFLIIPNWETWYWALGAVGMVLLFCFISIPMIEKNFLTYKPNYAVYQRQVSMLLLLPRKKEKPKAEE